MTAMTRATNDTAARSLRAALVVALLAAPHRFAAAQDSSPPKDEVLLGRFSDIDKAPRLAGDWCCWTSDRSATTSSGTVTLSRLSTGELWHLDDGCLPDVGVLDDGSVRVAYLQLAADGVAVRSLTFPAASPTTPTASTCLARGLRWADHLRVCGDVTVFSACDADGVLRIFACAGRGPPVAISREGEAFRPEPVRDARGAVHCVWDAYRPGPGLLDYEIYHAVRGADGRWSVPVNVSGAPCSLDTEPSAAADRDGGLWLAWATNRGARRLLAFVEHLAPDGTALLAPAWPAVEGDAADPGADAAATAESPDARRVLPAMHRGTITMSGLRGVCDPRVVVDGSGRVWLFVTGQPTGTTPLAVVGRQIWRLVLDADGWSEPQLVTEGTRDGIDPTAEAVPGDPLAVRMACQVNALRFGGLQIETRVLREPRSSKTAAVPPDFALQPPAGPPLPQRAEIAPELPGRRTLQRDGRSFRLDFADLHCHTGASPDGVGERDAAIFFARDVAQLDAVAITDHDERLRNPLTDWDYELGRRFVDLFDTPDFIAFMGFEWTNDVPVRPGEPDRTEVPGHRNCFDSRCCYRYTDPAVDSLPELYRKLDAEDAIGNPHHLGLFHGSSFLQTDPLAQPVIEVSSQHGEFEQELWDKLIGNRVTAGVVSGGDNHTSRPGTAGLAAVWVEERGPPGDVTLENSSSHAAFKDALRHRRCFGTSKNGLWIDASLEGEAPGAVLHLPADAPHALHLHVSLDDIAYDDRGEGVNVNVVRDGDFEHPLWFSRVSPGKPFEADAVLPALDRSAVLMLRVSEGAGCAPKNTIVWTSPYRVEIR